MARRVYTYPNVAHLGPLNVIATAGGDPGIGVVVFFLDVLTIVYGALRCHAPWHANPWDGYSLEWATTSPPPEFNFEGLPPIRSRRPVWDAVQS